MASRVDAAYVIQDLGTLPGGLGGFGLGLNNLGQVTGLAYNNGGAVRAILWSSGLMQDLGTLGGTYSYGSAINDAGHVTGYASTAGNAFDHCFGSATR